MQNSNRKIRLWPAIVILTLAAVTLIYIWGFGDGGHRQDQVMKSAPVFFFAFLLLLIWFLFFSRLVAGKRFRSFLIVVAVVAAFFAIFRIQGVSGDLIPVFAWRWGGDNFQQLVGAANGATDTTADSENWLSPTDYPQFLGQNRDGVVSNFRLEADWKTNPPKELWRVDVGAGWSSFSVVGNSAITQEQRGALEAVVCYDLKTGKVKWSHVDSSNYANVLAGNGPRATPTIEAGRVYTLGATGVLNCLDFNSGRRLWSKNILKEFDGRANTWGVSTSPFILDSLVVVSTGSADDKSLIALHKESGEFVWGAGRHRSGYASPFIARFHDTDQIVMFNYEGVLGHDPATGAVLWHFEWPKGTEPIAQPLPIPGEKLFVSSGYGIGGAMLQIEKNESGGFAATRLWKTPRMKAKLSNMFYIDGYIYGLDDGVMACIELEKGQRKWKGGRYGHGQLLLVDKTLLIQAESGDLILVEPNPEKHAELARFEALNGKTWNHPTLAGNLLLVRNDQEAACYELTGESLN